jgi:hypothetical protein
MSKRKKGAAPETPAAVSTPTDVEAAAGAQTQAHPLNLEEQEKMNRSADPDLDDRPADPSERVQGTQPIPEPPAPSMLARIAAAATTGWCEKCGAACTPDPKKVHRCARCRSEALVEPDPAA